MSHLAQTKFWQRPQPLWVMLAFNMLFLFLFLGVWAWTQTAAQEAGTEIAEVDDRTASINTATTSSYANTISIQGLVSDISGDPLDGTVNLSFSLYDSLTGGALLFGNEAYANHPVHNGVYTVRLGSQTADGISPDIWNGDVYLETSINGQTLNPREVVVLQPEPPNYPQLSRHILSRPDGTIIEWNTPTNVVTFDYGHCANGTWCCDSTDSICINRGTSDDAMLELDLSDAESVTCMMAHNEDDNPINNVGLVFATDVGNQSYRDGNTLRIMRSGHTHSPIATYASYVFTCGW